jgi:predicted enzyme related to lactoylglutathione lyase
VVKDIRGAIARAMGAGAKVERDVTTHAYGLLALMADPFGNGFCLLEFRGRGYDEIALKDAPRAPA